MPPRPDPYLFLTGHLDGTTRPRSVSEPGKGGRLDPQGRALPWPGNTIMCHLDRNSSSYEAVCDLSMALQQGPHADYFAFLPSPSFHMTVFQGVSLFDGARAGWPDGVAETTPSSEIDTILLDRLRNFRVKRAFQVRPAGLFAGHSLTLAGATTADEAQLREMRTTLRDATGIYPRRFDAYVFHVTLAYQLAWLSDVAALEVLEFGDRLYDEFVAEVPRIDLGPIQFCRFHTVFDYEPLQELCQV